MRSEVREATLDLSADLHDDLKFTELAATTLGMLRQTRLLQRRQDSLRPFFAPVVRHALANAIPTKFCRHVKRTYRSSFATCVGFPSRVKSRPIDCSNYCARVSDALGVMTHQILARDGVVGDFHGDAAWVFGDGPSSPRTRCSMQPKLLGHPKRVRCRAAIADHPLSAFARTGNRTHGIAVAGRIGTVDQVKVTVFGPVVNLAARLESMTKQRGPRS